MLTARLDTSANMLQRLGLLVADEPTVLAVVMVVAAVVAAVAVVVGVVVGVVVAVVVGVVAVAGQVLWRSVVCRKRRLSVPLGWRSFPRLRDQHWSPSRLPWRERRRLWVRRRAGRCWTRVSSVSRSSSTYRSGAAAGCASRRRWR